VREPPLIEVTEEQAAEFMERNFDRNPDGSWTTPKKEPVDPLTQLLDDVRRAFIDERGWLFFFGLWVGIIVGGFAVWWNP
jgi:hypothetical protein